jgi:hypothetical protein
VLYPVGWSRRPAGIPVECGVAALPRDGSEQAEVRQGAVRPAVQPTPDADTAGFEAVGQCQGHQIWSTQIDSLPMYLLVNILDRYNQRLQVPSEPPLGTHSADQYATHQIRTLIIKIPYLYGPLA